MSSQLLLTVAVHSYKNPEMLRMCLDSIFEHVRDISFEVIVSDGATEEETYMMMRHDFPTVRFFPFVENVGFSALVNNSIEHAQGEYLFIINADIVLTLGGVDHLLSLLQSDSSIGVCGPKQLSFDGTLQYTCFRFYRMVTILYRRTFLKKFSFVQRHLAWFTMNDFDHNTVRDVDWLLGSALMMSRKSLDIVGLMDRRFFMYMEDVDWCRRFWENNLRVVYDPHAVIYHYYGKGSARGGFFYSLFFNRLTWVHIVSAVKYFRKYWRKSLPR
ncbi:MAG: glycosyltransferase [Candidatus Moranbacteria bacterium]|nr:glycosyltransferase [Candidatus Moranbacteria bacterium]